VLGKADYRGYITSPEWREKHKEFLKRSHYRCSFSLLPIGKKIKGKYHGYAMHHMNYENLGDERLWIDVIALHPFIHRWVLHGILSGFKRPSQQKKYPNTAQQIFHFWCCQPPILRNALLLIGVLNVLIQLF
jgi:hypothetical protein